MVATTVRLARVPQDAQFGDQAFADGSALESIGRELIDEHGHQFEHLRGASIMYFWKRKGGSSKGKQTLARCAKPSGILRHISESDFVLWVAADHARDQTLSEDQLRAAVYHELCHAGVNDDGAFTMWDHDFTGFRSELEHFGAWTNDLKLAARAFSQLPLFGDASNGT